jgi:hypothetical protein
MMKTFDIRNSKLIGPIAVVSVLGLLHWLDTIHISWCRQTLQSFNTTTFSYFVFMLPVVFAVLVSFLSWLLLVFSGPTRVEQGPVSTHAAQTVIAGLTNRQVFVIRNPDSGNEFCWVNKSDENKLA